jgi:hypothetical protein
VVSGVMVLRRALSARGASDKAKDPPGVGGLRDEEGSSR